MNFGQITRKWLHVLTILAAALTFAGVSQAAIAQEADLAEAVDAVEEVAGDAPAFEHFGADMIKGQPVFAEDDFWGSMTFQPQHTATGEDVVTTGLSSREAIKCVEEEGGEVIAEVAVVDRSAGSVDLGVPFFALVAINFPTYTEDEIPAELAAIRVTKPGSRSEDK